MPAARTTLAAALVLWGLLAWPLRHGSAYLDDWVFIAMGRHLQEPLLLLYKDSLGAFFFRPLSMFLWWCTAQVFGDSAPAHLAFSVGVHAANGVLVYALLRLLEVHRGCAAAAALIFIVHPAAFSASAWLSDRFDLFATFFGLIGLVATERYLRLPSPGRAAAMALAMLASMYSKEIGFAVALTAAGMLVLRADRHTADFRRRAFAVALLTACVVIVLGSRQLALRSVAEHMFLREGLAATLWGGLYKWGRYLPDFLVVVQGRMLSVIVWLAALMGLLLAALLPNARAALRSRHLVVAVLVGIGLTLASVLAQAPIVHASSIVPYTLDRFGFDSLAGGRFYYLPFAGLAVFLAALGEAVLAAASRRGAIVAVLFFAASLVALTTTSRNIARSWAAFPTTRGEPVIRDAIARVMERNDYPPGCKFYFLDLPHKADAVRGLIDTAVKQSLPRGHSAMACFVNTENTPWYHVVAGRALPANAEAPLEIMLFAGRPYAPLPVGNLTYYYLKADKGAEIARDPRATFYAWRDNRFVDVTADVREGRRAVRFFDNRPPY